MRIDIILTIAFTITLSTVIGQNIFLDDLIYFQATKNPVKIDSVLLTKAKWDCNCIREFDNIRMNRVWIYDIADSTKESVDKDHLELDDIGYGFASIIKYYTSDKAKAQVILSEMHTRLKEEKIKIISNDSINARVSFFVGKDVVVETIVGENRTRGVGKYVFVLMDKLDYLKGLTIK